MSITWIEFRFPRSRKKNVDKTISTPVIYIEIIVLRPKISRTAEQIKINIVKYVNNSPEHGRISRRTLSEVPQTRVSREFTLGGRSGSGSCRQGYDNEQYNWIIAKCNSCNFNE